MVKSPPLDPTPYRGPKIPRKIEERWYTAKAIEPKPWYPGTPFIAAVRVNYSCGSGLFVLIWDGVSFEVTDARAVHAGLGVMAAEGQDLYHDDLHRVRFLLPDDKIDDYYLNGNGRLRCRIAFRLPDDTGGPELISHAIQHHGRLQHCTNLAHTIAHNARIGVCPPGRHGTDLIWMRRLPKKYCPLNGGCDGK